MENLLTKAQTEEKMQYIRAFDEFDIE